MLIHMLALRNTAVALSSSQKFRVEKLLFWSPRDSSDGTKMQPRTRRRLKIQRDSRGPLSKKSDIPTFLEIGPKKSLTPILSTSALIATSPDSQTSQRGNGGTCGRTWRRRGRVSDENKRKLGPRNGGSRGQGHVCVET